MASPKRKGGTSSSVGRMVSGGGGGSHIQISMSIPKALWTEFQLRCGEDNSIPVIEALMQEFLKCTEDSVLQTGGRGGTSGEEEE